MSNKPNPSLGNAAEKLKLTRVMPSLQMVPLPVEGAPAVAAAPVAAAPSPRKATPPKRPYRLHSYLSDEAVDGCRSWLPSSKPSGAGAAEHRTSWSRPSWRWSGSSLDGRDAITLWRHPCPQPTCDQASVCAEHVRNPREPYHADAATIHFQHHA